MLLKLAGVQMLFSALFQFATLFVTVYYSVGGGVRRAALFNLILFVAWGIAFFIAFRLTERGTRTGLILAGTFNTLGMCSMLWHIGGIWLASVCIGCSGGFFWPSFLYVYQSMGKISEDGQLFARVSLWSSLISLFIPMIVGLIVAGAGFRVGFAIMLVLSICLALLGSTLPNARTERIRFTRSSWQHPAYYLTNIARGYFFSFISMAGGLLVYAATGNEAVMGSLATLFGLISLLSNTILAYAVPDRFQKPALIASGLLYIVASTLFFGHGLWIVIAYNVLLAVANPFANNVIVALNFAYMRRRFTNQAEAMLTREWALTVGRALFFGGMMAFGLNAKSHWFLGYLITISVVPLLAFIGSLSFNRKEPANTVSHSSSPA